MEDFLLALRPTFPDAQMLQSRLFPASNLVVIETTHLTFKECSCDQFHFLISLHQAPVIRTENKLYKLREMSVFPCNPQQRHRIEDTGITDFKALILYIEKTFLRSVSEELFGNSNLELKNNCFLFSPALKELIYTFIRECRVWQPGSALMLESLSVQAAIHLLRDSSNSLSLSSLHLVEYEDNKSIKKAIEYIVDNYRNSISLSDLAFETHYSPYHLLRLFKHHTGKTPFKFLLDVKIEKAKSFLQHTDYSMSQICDLCGFSCVSYFSQVFKKKTGLTPTQFKSQYRLHNSRRT